MNRERLRSGDDIVDGRGLRIPEGVETLRLLLRPRVPVLSGASACALADGPSGQELLPSTCGVFPDGPVEFEVPAAALDSASSLLVVIGPGPHPMSASEAQAGAQAPVEAHVLRIPLKRE